MVPSFTNIQAVCAMQRGDYTRGLTTLEHALSRLFEEGPVSEEGGICFSLSRRVDPGESPVYWEAVLEYMFMTRPDYSGQDLFPLAGGREEYRRQKSAGTLWLPENGRQEVVLEMLLLLQESLAETEKEVEKGEEKYLKKVRKLTYL